MSLAQPQAFYAVLRSGILGPKLEPLEIEGCEAILAAMDGTPLSHCAYAFATAYHETAATMQPVREAYWLSENWRKKNLKYWPWYGRGYVQLTWEANYKKADDKLILGGALVKNLDLAMQPDIAARIMRRGMAEGWFAGDKAGRHTLARHLPQRLGTLAQYQEARRIINGTDKALLIARYALQFQDALTKGEWA